MVCESCKANFNSINGKKVDNLTTYMINFSEQHREQVSLGNLRRFQFKELQIATKNFSSKNILGKGGFGNVYKGYLQDGTVVAVKRLKDGNAIGGVIQFQTEVEMISLAVHRNLLGLYGFCMTTTERLLVYPYMSNGSVASRLKGKKKHTHICLTISLVWKLYSTYKLWHSCCSQATIGVEHKEKNCPGGCKGFVIPPRAVWSQDNSQGREGCKHLAGWLLWGRGRGFWSGKAFGSPWFSCHHSCKGYCGAYSSRVSLHRPVLRKDRCFWIRDPSSGVDHWPTSPRIRESSQPERSYARLGECRLLALVVCSSSLALLIPISICWCCMHAGEENSPGKEAGYSSWQGSQRHVWQNRAGGNGSSSSLVHPVPTHPQT